MEFVCRVGTPEGRVIERNYEAADVEALRSELEKQGLHLFNAKRRGLGSSLSMPRFGRRGRKALDAQEFLLFNQEMAALLRAGLPSPG